MKNGRSFGWLSFANRNLGTVEYNQKRAVFQQSCFAITRKLANDNADWAPERIAVQ